MPIVVNKEEKVQLICQKAYDQFIEHGIENISLNQLITHIGISKGQFYHYFKTKEELIFEVMSHKTLEEFELCSKALKESKSLDKSLSILFYFYISDEKDAKDLRELLFDCLYLYTHSKDEKIKEYNRQYYKWIDEKLLEIFNHHNINTLSEAFIKSISATADGMYLRSLADSSFNLQEELTSYLTNVTKLIEEG